MFYGLELFYAYLSYNMFSQEIMHICKLINNICVFPPAGCGLVVNNTPKSPGYPYNYPPYMDCNYTIAIPPNMSMNISFIDFELEDEYLSSCRLAQSSYFKLSYLLLPTTRSVTSFNLSRIDWSGVNI